MSRAFRGERRPKVERTCRSIPGRQSRFNTTPGGDTLAPTIPQAVRCLVPLPFSLSAFFTTMMDTVLTKFLFRPYRHATRRPRHLPIYSSPQASHDVLGHPVQGDPNNLQKVYAECEWTLCGARRRAHMQPLEIYVDDETKLTLHGLQQFYTKLEEKEKNRKLNELLDSLEFNQVCSLSHG